MSATAAEPGARWVSTPEAQRLRAAFEMHDFGVELYRQRMRRERNGVDESEVEALTRAWLIAPPRPDWLRDALGDRAW